MRIGDTRCLRVLSTLSLVIAVSVAQIQPARGDASESGVRGITGSDTRGITGSDTRGITGSDLRGITGSDTRGITGSDARGITGSDAKGITGSDLRGGIETSLRAVALGPIDAIHFSKTAVAITVVGQTFIGAKEDVDQLSEGDYVLVAGSGEGDLSLLMSLDVAYVPGSSPVWVRGSVDSADPATAYLSIGFATFDYTAALVGDPTYAPQAGAVVELGGIQPVSGGAVLVSPREDATNIRGITGSDLRGITGSDLRGITGSDRR